MGSFVNNLIILSLKAHNIYHNILACFRLSYAWLSSSKPIIEKSIANVILQFLIIYQRLIEKASSYLRMTRKMRANFQKKSVFFRIVNCIILVSFFLTAIPLRSYADITNSANLRKSAAREDNSISNGILKLLYEGRNKIALIDGEDILLPKDSTFSGKVDQVITISDYIRTLVPGLTYLEGEPLDLFIKNQF